MGGALANALVLQNLPFGFFHSLLSGIFSMVSSQCSAILPFSMRTANNAFSGNGIGPERELPRARARAQSCHRSSRGGSPLPTIDSQHKTAPDCPKGRSSRDRSCLVAERPALRSSRRCGENGFLVVSGHERGHGRHSAKGWFRITILEQARLAQRPATAALTTRMKALNAKVA
jgi:hypothetical protein